MGGEIDFLPLPSPLSTSTFRLMPSPLTAFSSLTSLPLFFRIGDGYCRNY